MIDRNIVKKSAFAYGTQELSRLDPEFCIKEIADAENRLRMQNGYCIYDIVDKYTGDTLNDSYCLPEEITNYIAIDSIDTFDGLTFPQRLLYKDRPSRASYVVKKGDILVSNVRPNRGGITYITSRCEGNMASSGFTLLRTKEDSPITAEMLFAFLKSGFGMQQLVRRNRNSMYPAVSEIDVFEVYLPLPSKKISDTISTLVKSMFEMQDKFFELQEKQATLLDEYIKDFPIPPSPLSGEDNKIDRHIVNHAMFYGEKSYKRFDADFFRQEYFEFEKLLKSKTTCGKIGEYFDVLSGRSVGDGNDNVPYLKQAVLTNYGINWSAVSDEIGNGKNSTGRVKNGDVLLACTAHEIFYVGRKVDFVRNMPEEIKNNNICVADIMILRPKKELPDYLSGDYVAAFLRNPIGLYQVQRNIRGLRGGHIYPGDISENVLITLPTKNWINDFNKLSVDKEKLRNQSKDMFNTVNNYINNWISELVKK